MVSPLVEDCIFCAIASGSAPARRVAERADAVAFLPLNALAPGHTLVVPRQHAADIFEVSPPALAASMSLVRDLAKAMVSALAAGGVNILNASGKDSEQSVFHLHFHVIPRWKNDGITTWPQGRAQVDDIPNVHQRLRERITGAG